MQTSTTLNLLNLDLPAMERFFVGMGEKPFRGAQVVQWIHQHGVTQFDAMTNLGKDLRARLAEVAEIRLPEVRLEQCSRDGTRKWVISLDDGNCIETVFIPEDGRGTLCVSSQVGCALDCTFCSTARQGFNRNLSVAEIIGQVWIAVRSLGEARRITNIVMMGMGEPLLNYRNVVSAMELMKEDLAYGLARRRVTLSTAGVVPALERLAHDSDVSLAVSLHAPDDELRNTLVPLNRKYPIRELLAACANYVSAHPKSKVTFEYVLLDGVNDSMEHAGKLVKLLSGIPAKINLIPFNPFPGAGYRCSRPEVMDSFRRRLMAAGMIATTRKTRGDDIDAACGQLVGQVQDRSRRHLRFPVQLEGVAR